MACHSLRGGECWFLLGYLYTSCMLCGFLPRFIYAHLSKKKRIGDGCGGFIAVDEDTTSLTELQ